jgi:hypothetical protein
MNRTFIAIAALACVLASPAHSQVIPDGRGGFVPFTNSRVMPDGSLRPYIPEVDGPPMGSYYVPTPGLFDMLFGGLLGWSSVPPAYPYPDPPPGPPEYYLTPSPYVEEQVAPEFYGQEPAAPKRRKHAANQADREHPAATPIPTPSCAEDAAFCEDEPAGNKGK